VLGRARVELVDLEMLRAFDHMQPAERNRCHDSASASTVRTIAPPRIDHAIRKLQLQHHRTAMAGGSMRRLYNGLANLPELHQCFPWALELSRRQPT
jgi:hypothetical protein